MVHRYLQEQLKIVEMSGRNRAQELREGRGGRPGLPSLISLRFRWTSGNTQPTNGWNKIKHETKQTTLATTVSESIREDGELVDKRDHLDIRHPDEVFF